MTDMIVLPSQFDEALRIPRSMGPTCLMFQERGGSPTLTEGRYRIVLATYKGVVVP